MPISTGLTGRAETMVCQENTALAMGSGSLPVFATPAMTALMERAAVNALAPHLGEGETTVGIKLDITHDSATPIGLKVWAQCELLEVSGRRYVFTVTAHDERGPIGRGVHERCLVRAESFLARTEQKRGDAL